MPRYPAASSKRAPQELLPWFSSLLSFVLAEQGGGANDGALTLGGGGVTLAIALEGRLDIIAVEVSVCIGGELGAGALDLVPVKAVQEVMFFRDLEFQS